MGSFLVVSFLVLASLLSSAFSISDKRLRERICVCVCAISDKRLRERICVCVCFSRFWDQLYGPFRLGLGTELRSWSQDDVKDVY